MTSGICIQLSSIQSHRVPNATATATVILLDIIAVAILLQLNQIPLVLSFPAFLFPVGTYTAIIGFRAASEPHKTEKGNYFFTWAAIMLAVGLGWVLLYEGSGFTYVTVAVLSVSLGFMYINKAKNRNYKTGGIIKTNSSS